MRQVVILVCAVSLLFACSSDDSVVTNNDFFKVYVLGNSTQVDVFDFQEVEDVGFVIYSRVFQGNRTIEPKALFLLTDQIGNIIADTIHPTLFVDTEELNAGGILFYSEKLVRSGTDYFFIDQSGFTTSNASAHIIKMTISPTNETAFQMSDHYMISDQGVPALGERGFDLLAGSTLGELYLSGVDQNGTYYLGKIGSGNLIWNVEASTISDWDPNRTPPYTDVIPYLSLASYNGSEAIFIRRIGGEPIFGSSGSGYNIKGFFTADGSAILDTIAPHEPISIVGAFPVNTNFPTAVYENGGALHVASMTINDALNENLLPKITYGIVDNGGSTMAIPDSLDRHEFSTRELVRDYPVSITKVSKGGVDALIYMGTTNNGQILLLSFNQATGDLLNRRLLGFDSFYIGKRFLQTSDGGFAVLGEVVTAGRFKQICLFKFSPSELDFLLQ
ncbi:MAG: hypothetical protein ACPGJS_11230 [Flammeovirgaceae bacterium]